MTTYTHTPVLLQRCIELLEPAIRLEGAVVVDGTLGLAGHAEAILEQFPTARLLGVDRDPDALEIASHRLERFADRVTIAKARYDDIDQLLDTHFPGEAPQGILLDLGVSSLQLDQPERGFSYRFDAPLDMRMSSEDETTAAELLNTLGVFELQRLFERFGDEPYANRYAQAIVQARHDAPLTHTQQLVAIIDQATPGGHPRRGHNAKRVFQALRIAVNQELDILATAIDKALDVLAVGGRIVVMSYHSGEDRIVKHAIEKRTQSTAPLDMPIVPESDQPTFRWVVKGPEGASEDEIHTNPRSQSVRLRAAEKIRQASR